MAKKITDEMIISKLMNYRTIKDTANALGVSERMLYDRMNDGDFKVLYKSVKADIIRKAVFEFNEYRNSAVETVLSIMNDEKINPAIRLQSAQTILNYGIKFSERLNDDETKVSNQIASNQIDDEFDFLTQHRSN